MGRRRSSGAPVLPGAADRAPTFSAEQAAALVLRVFDVAAEAVTPLPSERDQNFLLATAAGERLVLKVSHAGEALGVLELQHLALERLDSAFARAASEEHDPHVLAGFRFARPRLSVDGRAIASVDLPGGAGHLVRLMDYVPGEPLATVRPHTPALLEELGTMLAAVDRALEEVVHPAAGRELYWNVVGGRELVEAHIDAIAAGPRREMIRRHLVRFDAEAAPRLPDLRRSLIHGDANDWNVLVSRPARPADPARGTAAATSREPGQLRLGGLLDFGDMGRSWLVAEPAIAAAYAMLGKKDPIHAAASVARGYHRTLRLRVAEVEVFYQLAVLRLCMSVTFAAVQRATAPANEYLSISEAPAWELLKRLDAVHPRLARYVIREACGLPPCPAAGAVVAWIGAHEAEIGPVLQPDPASAEPLVLDLGVDSPLLEDVLGREADAAAWSEAVFRRIREAGAGVGIGRYDEPRCWYTADSYRVDTDAGGEWRTVHIGIDLFAPAGTHVLAPLDGRVETVRDNAARLDYGPTVVLRHEPTGGGVFFTLFGHLSPDSLDLLAPGRTVRAGDRIGSIGDHPRNGDWAPHLHLQLIVDALDRPGSFPGVARPSERRVWTSLCPDPNLLLRIRGGSASERPVIPTLRRRREQRLGPSLSLSYRRPLHIVRGWMQRLYDAEGQPYLDCVNNVAHVGHCHPRVVAALRRQASQLNTNTRYLHELILRYAERLSAKLHPQLSVCFFVCSGSEANELALRLARAHTGRRDVVVLDAAYHGNTSSLVEISPYKFDGPGGAGRPPHVHVAPIPDPYRGEYRSSDEHAGARYAERVGEAMAEADGHGGVAAFFAEALPGCAGQIVPPAGYLAQAFRRVRERGGVCVADEVQVGFGRVGSHFWAFEAQSALPDIVTLGKPIGNGHPLGAVVTTPEIAASFANGMEYFNTFGGNPVSCAVGLAVLDVIEDEGLQAHAREVGARLLAGLRSLMTRHALIGDVRGTGLFIGVELVVDREARNPAPRHAIHVVERMRENGILLSTDGPDHDVIKIKPPLVFSAADADRLVDTLDRVLAEL